MGKKIIGVKAVSCYINITPLPCSKPPKNTKLLIKDG